VPTYNHHQNTQIVPYSLILLCFHNKPVAQRQSGELVSQGSQVLISLMTNFFFSQKSFWRSILMIVKMKKKLKKKLKKKNWKKKIEKKKSRFFLKIWKKWSLKLIFNMEKNTCSAICRENHKAIFRIDLQKWFLQSSRLISKRTFFKGKICIENMLKNAFTPMSFLHFFAVFYKIQWFTTGSFSM
jgi:hypothetical protein